MFKIHNSDNTAKKYYNFFQWKVIFPNIRKRKSKKTNKCSNYLGENKKGDKQELDIGNKIGTVKDNFFYILLSLLFPQSERCASKAPNKTLELP